MPSIVTPRVLVETIHGVTLVNLAEAELLDEEVINEVSEQLQGLLEGGNPDEYLLSFRDVRLMSSTMLGVLLKFARRTNALGGQVKLCCIAPDLAHVFRITRFDRLFEIYDEESSALDSFGS